MMIMFNISDNVQSDYTCNRLVETVNGLKFGQKSNKKILKL